MYAENAILFRQTKLEIPIALLYIDNLEDDQGIINYLFTIIFLLIIYY
jgi:hypothetical protein